MGNPYLNASGLPDPTAYEAIKEVTEEDQRFQTLLRTIKNVIRLADYDLENRIELRDRRTGKVYR